MGRPDFKKEQQVYLDTRNARIWIGLLQKTLFPAITIGIAWAIGMVR